MIMTDQEDKMVTDILKLMDEDEYWNPSHEISEYELRKRLEIDRFIKALDSFNSD